MIKERLSETVIKMILGAIIIGTWIYLWSLTVGLLYNIMFTITLVGVVVGFTVVFVTGLKATVAEVEDD